MNRRLRRYRGAATLQCQGIGDVHLSDVADVFVADNSDAVYASINGNPGVMLTFSKQSKLSDGYRIGQYKR